MKRQPVRRAVGKSVSEPKRPARVTLDEGKAPEGESAAQDV